MHVSLSHPLPRKIPALIMKTGTSDHSHQQHCHGCSKQGPISPACRPPAHRRALGPWPHPAVLAAARAGKPRLPAITHQPSSRQISPPPPTHSTPVHPANGSAQRCTRHVAKQPQHKARQDLPLPLLQGNIKSLFGHLKSVTRYRRCSTLSVSDAGPVRQPANILKRHTGSHPVTCLLLASSGVTLLIRNALQQKGWPRQRGQQPPL